MGLESRLGCVGFLCAIRAAFCAFAVGLAALGLTGCGQTTAPQSGTSHSTATSNTVESPFLIIAHRGASARRPEHTLAAYELGIEQGADFIELDLVPTLDGALIARHENALAVVALTKDNEFELDSAGKPTVLQATTDIAERAEFADRLAIKVIDGVVVGGWFSEDFSLAEIKSLKARERIPQIRPANVQFDDRFSVPTLEEAIALVQQPENARVGLYIELKHPTYFALDGRRHDGQPIAQDTAQLLVNTLQKAGFTSRERLFLQCFEIATLRRLQHDLLPAAGFDAPLVQLFGRITADSAPYDLRYHLGQETDLATVYGPLAPNLQRAPSYLGLASTASVALIRTDYANGVGPSKNDLAKLADAAIAAEMHIHPYTVRPEPFFLSPLRGGLATSAAGEVQALRKLGATGVFIDLPAAVQTPR